MECYLPRAVVFQDRLVKQTKNLLVLMIYMHLCGLGLL